jgi:putative tryptophan/tyrosine transport system substrate-binding protein
MSQLHARALPIMGDSFFSSHSQQIGEMVARHGIPAIYTTREFAAAGGLMTYAPADADATRLVGIYAGRILKGENPTCWCFSPPRSKWLSTSRPRRRSA